MALPPPETSNNKDVTRDDFVATPLPTPERPHVRHFALQCAAVFAILSLAWPYFGLRNEVLPWPETALAIGGLALLIASFSRQPWWWRLIHALFTPLAWWVSTLAIDPGWFLLCFILLLLVYRGAISGQVPLYLSNSHTASAIAELTGGYPRMRFIDLGAGIGSILYPLSKARPEALVFGVENAPGTWLVGYLRTIGASNCTWHWGDLWRTPLADYDVVYAFLSPAPMPALWEKVQCEMRPGSLFISNSFSVPDVAISRVVELDDARQTRLYCYVR